MINIKVESIVNSCIAKASKFNGEHYQDFVDNVSEALTALNLKEFIDGPVAEPARVDGSFSEQHEATVLEHHKNKGLTLMVIKALCDEQRKHMVAGIKDPYEIMMIFKKAYASQTTQNRMRLLALLHDYSFDSNKTVLENINKLESICRSLENCDSKQDEHTKVYVLLKSLPIEWKHLADIWRNEQGMTFDTLRMKLIDNEPYIRKESKNDKALVVRHRFSDKNKNKVKPYGKAKCGFCKYLNHSESDCFFKKGSDSKGNKYCSNCIKKGHTHHECKSKSMAGLCLVSALMAKEFASNVWVIDSGCSHHMTGNLRVFEKYTEADHGIEPIEVANGAKLPVSGFGQVKLSNGMKIGKALYVPSLTFNLLSVKMLMKNGYNVVFKDDQCYITMGDEKVINATKHDNVFVIADNRAMSLYSSSQISQQLLHQRFGHINMKRILQAVDMNISHDKNFKCESCIYGKQHRLKFGTTARKTTEIGELIHSDLVGPLPLTRGKRRYLLTFIDDFTDYCSVSILKTKDEVYEAFKEFCELTKRQHGHQVKCLRSDNGGEYLNHSMTQFMQDNGIRHEFTTSYTPQQNGKAERKNRTLIEMVRCLLHWSHLNQSWWAEAVVSGNFILNCTKISVLNKTPYELWTGHKPDYSRFKVWGCVAFTHIPEQKRSKLDFKSRKGIFMGYDLQRKAYKVWIPETSDMLTSRDVIFYEDQPGGLLSTSPVLPPSDISPILDNSFTLDMPSIPDHQISPSVSITEPAQSDVTHSTVAPSEPVDLPSSGSSSSPNDDAPFYVEVPSLGRKVPLGDTSLFAHAFLTHSESALHHHFALRSEANVPSTITAAQQTDEWEKWKEAIQSEYDSLIENGTWELADLPKGRKAIGCKWVLKKKYDEKGELKRYKARLVAKGYDQKEGIDFTETFAPVVKFNSLRMLLALAAKYDLEIDQCDFVTAFLNGDLTEEIYIEQPEGYVQKGQEHKVLRLRKSLYGLKQAPRQWNKKFDYYVVNEMGYERLLTDSSIYVKRKGQIISILAIYVDDLLIISNSKEDNIQVRSELAKEFKMNYLGPIGYIVGIEVLRDRSKREIKITQRQYIKNVLKKFNMENCKSAKTPLSSSVKLCKNGILENNGDQNFKSHEENGKDNPPYMEAVGSLIYAMIGTRPDICYAVGVVSRYMSCYKKAHWEAVKHIMRYLKGTTDLAIVYDGSMNTPLQGYSDSDWGSDVDDRKSVSGYTFLLCNGAVSWHSKKQATVAKSTVEAEYVGLSITASEAKWEIQFLKELGFYEMLMHESGDRKTKKFKYEHTGTEGHEIKPLTIYGDNQGSQSLAKNPKDHSRTKHIDIHYHFIRNMIEEKTINIEYISTENMIADILTKSLGSNKHNKFVNGLGLKEADTKATQNSGSVEELH